MSELGHDDWFAPYEDLPETALARKPDTGRFEVERRVTAIRALTYRPQSVVVDVDADRPFTEVNREVTRIIWSHI